MSDHPVKTAYESHDDQQMIAYHKLHSTLVVATASELGGYDATLQFGMVFVRETNALYKLDTEDLSENDGVNVIYDAAGNHFIQVLMSGVQVNAVGTFSERDLLDDQASPYVEDGPLFVYLSTDGDGDAITDAVLFVKLSDDSADWSDAILVRGSQGEAGPQGDTGTTGTAATIAVGTVTTVEPTEPASVMNVGTSAAAQFNFEIPKGDPGVGIILKALSPEDYAAIGSPEDGMLYLTISGLAVAADGVNLVKLADESAFDALTPNANTVYIW